MPWMHSPHGLLAGLPPLCWYSTGGAFVALGEARWRVAALSRPLFEDWAKYSHFTQYIKKKTTKLSQISKQRKQRKDETAEHERELSGQSPVPNLKPAHKKGTLLLHYRRPWEHTLKAFFCCLPKASERALSSTPSSCLAQASRCTQNTPLDYPALMAKRADYPELYQIITNGKTILGRPSIPGPCKTADWNNLTLLIKKAYLLSLQL